MHSWIYKSTQGGAGGSNGWPSDLLWHEDQFYVAQNVFFYGWISKMVVKSHF